MRRETLLAHAGCCTDTGTGSITTPIYQTATFRHPALGESTGYDYSRTANPTRTALEQLLAKLDGGAGASAFASGLAAVDALLHLFESGDRIVVTEDLYGGTFRLIEEVYKPRGIEITYLDTSDIEAVEAAFSQKVSAIFVETPTNPLLKIADIEAIALIARAHGALTIVDNTFLTPVFQRPLELGADIVVYSASKYLGGHNDVVAGAVVSKSESNAEKIAYFQNAVGAILGPQDSWLLLRGFKTLDLRLERQEQNAAKVAAFLLAHQRVTKVHFPGLPGHPGHEILSREADGFGAMLSFEVDDPDLVPEILKRVKVFFFAESLGGVESLITFPAVQTHSAIDEETRDRLGITNCLLRISVGIENADDLIEDLNQALLA